MFIPLEVLSIARSYFMKDQWNLKRELSELLRGVDILTSLVFDCPLFSRDISILFQNMDTGR